MKNYLYFLVAFLVSVFLTVSCDKAFSKIEPDGNCYAYYWKITQKQTGVGYNLVTGQVSGTAYSIWRSGTGDVNCEMVGTGIYLYKKVPPFTANWGDPIASASAVSGLNCPGITTFNSQTGRNISITGASEYDERTDPDVCTPSVTCSELQGDTAPFVKIDGIGSTPENLCIDDCEVVQDSSVGVAVRKPDCDADGTADDPCTMIIGVEYTGQDCPAGGEELSPDDRNCTQLQAECDQLCEGGNNNTCTDPTTFTCDCQLPEYPVIQTGPGTYKPDQDEDLTPSDTDTDVDGDGTPNSEDDDVDGDGHPNGNDTDTDGDGTSNRGTVIWTNDDFSSGGYFDNHNGYGTDADLDGDGTPNATDPDIDGDGIANGSDPDMDGDGVSNGGDVDADGDGILDGADPDPDNDGLTGADDTDPDGSEVGDADTNNDGVVDENDEPYTPDDEWPTEDEIETGYDGVGDNTYDSTIEGDFTDPDFQGAASDFLDANPLTTDLDGSEIQLTNIDSCIDFPNPYTGGVEQFCFNEYETYWNIMGVIMVALTGFMCFRLIAWRY